MPDPNAHHPDMTRHDEVVGLRLELARVKDQRDAYQAALRKEVLEIVHQTIEMHLETIRPRDPHHGGKVYQMPDQKEGGAS